MQRQVLAELAELIDYRAKYLGSDPRANQILALGLASRKNLCVHPKVAGACPRVCACACMRVCVYGHTHMHTRGA